MSAKDDKAAQAKKEDSKAKSNERRDDNKKEEDDDDEEEHLNYKVVILGDGTVGKTSICMRFSDDQFDKSYKQTIGLDFFIKRVMLPGNVNVALQIWDIGGQSIGSKMISNYIFGSQAVLLVYDITNYQSFQNLEDWLQLVRKSFDKETMPYLALIGNKVDLGHLRTVKMDKHMRFADEHNMYSYLVSAKTGDNVSSAFYRIAADLAGCALSKNELEGAAKVVTAEIVNHPQHDPEQEQLNLDKKKKKDGGCSIQ